MAASSTNLAPLLERIAAALERLSPPPPSAPDFENAQAFVWLGESSRLPPVQKISRIPLRLLKGIDRTISTLIANTEHFADGLPANNALLWGARGMGKSSLIKAVHADVAKSHPRLKLIEIHREEIGTLPRCLALLRNQDYRFIIFCDDLSFDAEDTTYKSLKAVLEGGLEGRPDNVIFYATSNRRHLMAREMVENERATAINPSEATQEKVSLSDRFGLWLGFHNASQDDYLVMINAYAQHFNLPVAQKQLRDEALEWAITRGSRSGRVAWQYIQDLAGRLGKRLDWDN